MMCSSNGNSTNVLVRSSHQGGRSFEPVDPLQEIGPKVWGGRSFEGERFLEGGRSFARLRFRKAKHMQYKLVLGTNTVVNSQNGLLQKMM